MNTRIKQALCVGASLVALMFSSATQAQTQRVITVENMCAKPVRLYVSHADGFRNWHVHGPYIMGAFEGPNHLRDNGVVLTQSENHDLYIYAESLDGRRVWSGNHGFWYGGLVFNMTKVTLNMVDGGLRFRLLC